MFPLANRQHDYETPPRAVVPGPSGPSGPPSPTGPQGQMGAFTVSAVAQVLDLRTVVNVPPYDASQAQAQGGTNSPAGAPRGAVGHFLTIHADGADVGIVVGLSAALVSGGAAPNLAAVGSVDGSGNYTAATGTCYRVPNGQVRRFRLQNTEDHFMGVVAGATGTMRFYVSSPPNP